MTEPPGARLLEERELAGRRQLSRRPGGGLSQFGLCGAGRLSVTILARGLAVGFRRLGGSSSLGSGLGLLGQDRRIARLRLPAGLGLGSERRHLVERGRQVGYRERAKERVAAVGAEGEDGAVACPVCRLQRN